MLYTSESLSRKLLPIPNSFLPIPVNCNSILTLNMNHFDKDKVFVYCVFSYSSLQCAFPYGFFLIWHFENNSETRKKPYGKDMEFHLDALNARNWNSNQIEANSNENSNHSNEFLALN